MIIVENLKKEYLVPKKQEGLKGAIKHLVNPKYTKKVAVENVNFKINKGECVAYLGKNGAGKSTTIKMLTGILKPSSGKILINGIDPQLKKLSYNKNIGVVFGQRTQLWWDLPIIESFKLIKDIYEISDEKFKKNLGLFSELLGLNDYLHVTARKVSLGQRMKADIAAALLHDPQIVYLDEPTIGLDVLSKENIRNFLKHINYKFKTTILLTTHDMGDIEEICNRLILIDSGNLIYDGELEKVITKFADKKKIYFKTTCSYELKFIKEKINLEVDIEATSKKEFSITYKLNSISIKNIIEIVIQSIEIEDLRIEEVGIETILKEIYKGNLNLL